jgi:hypothetical protein
MLDEYTVRLDEHCGGPHRECDCSCRFEVSFWNSRAYGSAARERVMIDCCSGALDEATNDLLPPTVLLRIDMAAFDAAMLPNSCESIQPSTHKTPTH